MTFYSTPLFLHGILLAVISNSVLAGLGHGLTDTGAIVKGNSEGVTEHQGVSRWARNIPKNYKANYLYHSPYQPDRRVTLITQNNMQQYTHMLSEGHKTLLNKYASYAMPIFPSRRPVDYHPKLDKATARNHKVAKLQKTDAISRIRLGFPFPIPHGNAKKVIWNHKLRYRGNSVSQPNDKAFVSPQHQHYTTTSENILYTYGNLKYKKIKKKERQGYIALRLHVVHTPPKLMGQGTLTRETINQVMRPSRTYMSRKGDRKLHLKPTNGYSTPNDYSLGLAFDDQRDMFNGAMDRYSWKLLGKKTMYIPYNAYSLNDKNLTYKQVLGPNHLTPKYTRYEPHRVWIVQADNTNKTYHDIKRRVFYVYEDSWGIVMVDNYNHSGQLWRFQEGHTRTAYEVGVTTTSPEVSYDFIAGKYFVDKLSNEGAPTQFNRRTRLKPRHFRKRFIERVPCL